MKVTVRITGTFKAAVKPLLKKFPSLLSDLSSLEAELRENPKLGTPLGGNTYKIRLRIKSKSKGKSGGARVISLLETEVLGQLDYTSGEVTVSLITIYDKAEIAVLTARELKSLIYSATKK